MNTLFILLLGGLGALLVVGLVVAAVANTLTRTPGTAREISPEKTGSGKKNHASTLVGIGTAIALLGGVVAFAKNINRSDIAPEVKEMIVGQLHGTMLNARNSDPVVLIVPGSGPTDRDGNNPMGVKT